MIRVPILFCSAAMQFFAGNERFASMRILQIVEMISVQRDVGGPWGEGKGMNVGDAKRGSTCNTLPSWLLAAGRLEEGWLEDVMPPGVVVLR